MTIAALFLFAKNAFTNCSNKYVVYENSDNILYQYQLSCWWFIDTWVYTVIIFTNTEQYGPFDVPFEYKEKPIYTVKE